MFSEITLAIIAGGRSERLGGRVKGLLQIDGERVAERLDRLGGSFAEVLVVTADTDAYSPWSWRPVPDIEPGRGAPGGLVSALLAAKTDWVLAVACDMPFVNPSAVRLLTTRREEAGAKLVVFQVENHFQPFPGLYQSGLGRIWRSRLLANPSFEQLASGLRCVRVEETALREVDPEARTVVSLNTPEDCQRWGAR